MSLLPTMSMLFLCLSVLPSLSQLAYSQISSSSNNILPILSSSSFKDTLGSLHVVGELKNNSTDPFDFVKVVSTFYDSTGKVVGTDFTYSHIKVLRPWERSSFELILSDAQQSDKVNSYRLAVSGDKAEPLPAALKLSIGDSHMDDIGAYHIVGEVTNQGKERATFVQVSGAFYNSSNVAVAADFTFTDPKDLEPGQTAPFEIIVSAPTASDISSASLNVKSEQYSSIIENQTSS
jgi:hypothetical protein